MANYIVGNFLYHLLIGLMVKMIIVIIFPYYEVYLIEKGRSLKTINPYIKL